MKTNPALSALRHHVTGAIARGEAQAITEVPATQRPTHTPGPWHVKEQVCRILNAKIKRIATECYSKANPMPVKMHGNPKPYALPQEAHDMVEMLGRIESATSEELEQFAHFATTGEEVTP